MRRIWTREEGLSLVELLVVIAVLAVITSIAMPMFFSQQSAAYRATAIADGRAWSLATVDALNDVWNFGDPGGTITLNGGSLDISLLNPTPSSATFTQVPVAVSPNTTLVEGTISGTTWCMRLANTNQEVVFTEQGFVANAVGCDSTGAPLY